MPEMTPWIWFWYIVATIMGLAACLLIIAVIYTLYESLLEIVREWSKRRSLMRKFRGQ